METPRPLAAAWLILGALLACASCSKGQAAAPPTPCGDYFDAISANPCGTGPTLPASEIARIKARFEQVCAAYTTLPGSQMTGDALDACAAAIQAAGCAGAGTTPSACEVVGTLPAGSACNENFQCLGGVCFQGATVGEAGPAANSCGKCLSVPGVGQACSGSCTPGLVCDTSSTSPTCSAVTEVDAGTGCNGTTTVCSGGYCDANGTCQPFIALGQACASTAQCTPPATCEGQACESPGAAGAPCELDTDCTSGLGCSFLTMTCGAVVWASAGQPCQDLTRCLVGECDGAGICPTVLADGQSCSPEDDSSTCDTFSQCMNGTCALADADVCM